ncbi:MULTISPECIES: assimilatory sulfite reductase (NADPH) flavoprotein subunit [Bacillaceae]|uniref:assimilatory sulfite reductase (NADPH) flavoprotein subunit n=1 Tax=Bacillaceae TaxID=186817 RepID=UPI0004E0DC1C|nr:MULTISPECIES: assimilatory sulfite reductase (NADPH) flavoprotein subunit [Bacillaceae]MCM3361464.1 assimilatory sulfite reductase (NADPH) flavoprotein subunit [Niallia sp. MER TA 168]
MQLQVINSPFNQEQTELLNRLLPTLTESQKIWLNGYLSASTAAIATTAGEPSLTTSLTEQQVATPITKDITILFGSQTGNAQSLAKDHGSRLKELGFNVTVQSMADFKPNNLKKIRNLLIIVSTHGEGDPPDTAIAFHEFLHGKRAPKLEDFQYSVLALGDSSYEFFCETGKQFDSRLEELGGTRLYPRVDCDLDYEEPASEWFSGVVNGLNLQAESTAPNPISTIPQSIRDSGYSRSNPYYAEILDVINLNGQGSNKETLHVELSLEDSGISFEPGDSLGIFPNNDPELVDLLVKELGFSPTESVTINKQGEVLAFREALLTYYEITVLTKPLLEKFAKIAANPSLDELLAKGNEEKLKAYINGRDILDLIRDFGPLETNAQTFASLLRKLPTRLYSIASSYKANPDEAHLTIGAVRYHANGRDRNGVCSVQIAERIQPGDKLPIYIQNNENFKLPENPDTPIIMVGPGTGVAPFRSFLQEREEIGAEGKSWLFFGDQHFVTDFLYQTEWQNWLKDGVLTKMNIAFSRDKAEKVYVQHRMLEHSKELFEWLEEGAVLYICGDEKHMAHDVHQTLLAIIQKEGQMALEQAEEYVAAMKQNKRYQRDVY